MPTERTCQNCACRYPAVRNNQKYCRPCRLLRDLQYWNAISTKAVTCKHCGDRYRKTNRNTEACAKCEPSGWYGDCIVCLGENRVLERPATPICRGCARHPAADVRTQCLNLLAGHIGVAPTPEHDVDPMLAAVIRVAEVVAGRLGVSQKEAIGRAKEAMGLDPNEPTTKLAALRAALEAL